MGLSWPFPLIRLASFFAKLVLPALLGLANIFVAWFLTFWMRSKDITLDKLILTLDIPYLKFALLGFCGFQLVVYLISALTFERTFGSKFASIGFFRIKHVV